MVPLAKPKYKTSLPENQNTWGNLLNKKSTSVNTAINLKKKPKENSTKPDKIIKSKNLNVLIKHFFEFNFHYYCTSKKHKCTV